MYKIKINKLAAICLVLTHTMIHVYCALVNGIIKKSIWSNEIHKQGMFFFKIHGFRYDAYYRVSSQVFSELKKLTNLHWLCIYVY